MNKIFAILFSCTLIFSCSEKHAGNAGTGTDTNENFVRFDSAKEFLPGWSKENVIVCHTIADPDNMHPTNGATYMRAEINQYTQMTLLRTDLKTLEVSPSLVKQLPEISDDGLLFAFELRDEPKWDDGSPLSADDIIFTCKANKCPLVNNPQVKPYWDNVEDVIADTFNQKKFTVKMKTKYIQNLTFWTDYPVMQRAFHDKENVLANYSFKQFEDKNFNASEQHDLKTWADDFNDSKYGHDTKFLNGLGMYRISRWEQGVAIVLTQKENHWTEHSESVYETSFPDQIIFKINRDATSQQLELKSQEADVSMYTTTKTLLDLQQDSAFNKNYHSACTDTYNYTFLGMNMKPDGEKRRKFFTDKNVRRAVALLVPVDEMNKILNRGMNKRISSPVSFLKKEFNADLKPLPYDLDAANKLLDEAGWKDTNGNGIRDKVIDGNKVEFIFALNYFSVQKEWKDMALMISGSLEKAGVKAELNPLDVAPFMNAAFSHDFDMVLMSWSGASAPEDYSQMWHTESWSSFGSNLCGFGNAQTDALIDSIKITMNESERLPMAKRIQQVIYDEQPCVFLFASLRRNIVHKRFHNAEVYYERPGILLNNLKLMEGTSGKVITFVQ